MTYAGIPLDQLEDVYAQMVEVENQKIVYLGLPNPYTVTMVGQQRALSTGLDNAIRIMFPKPVSQFSCYLAALVGHSNVIPEATAWGYQRAYEGVPDQWMAYPFGPRRPMSGQYSAGTPVNDEFRWSYITLKNCRYWAGKFVQGSYGTPAAMPPTP